VDSLLSDVIRFYQVQLHRHPEAAAYLARRGIRQPEVIEPMRLSAMRRADVDRLRFFRFLSAVPADGLLLARRRNRSALLRELRIELTKVRTTLGIAKLIVPHMFRHTLATEMLRSGVSFPALMNCWGIQRRRIASASPNGTQ
jgi:integrase